MYYLKLSLLSCVLLSSPVLHSMNFHQKAVDSYQDGIDLKAVIALKNQQATLPCAGQDKSIYDLVNDDACDVHNPLNKAMLYLFEQNKVVDKGCIADCHCAEIQHLLELYGKGLYVIYTKNGKALPILLLGTTNENHVSLLTAYLISQFSQTKENRAPEHDNLPVKQASPTYMPNGKPPCQERVI